jgi:hypothetical protein
MKNIKNTNKCGLTVVEIVVVLLFALILITPFLLGHQRVNKELAIELEKETRPPTLLFSDAIRHESSFCNLFIVTDTVTTNRFLLVKRDGGALTMSPIPKN